MGATTYLMTSSHFLKRPAAWLHLVDRSGATVIGAPNFGYEHCLRQARDRQLEGLDLSRVRTALNGAEPIDPRALEGFTSRFSAYGFGTTCHAPAYGLAEATLTVSYPSADTGHTTVTVRSSALAEDASRPCRATRTPTEPPVSSGAGPREDEVILVDPTGERLAEGQIGEIWVRGPVIAAGYWGREDATRETFGAIAADGSGPWLRTGTSAPCTRARSSSRGASRSSSSSTAATCSPTTSNACCRPCTPARKADQVRSSPRPTGPARSSPSRSSAPRCGRRTRHAGRGAHRAGRRRA
ncbi:AMP-binding protein [Oerskovia sp. M15]